MNPTASSSRPSLLPRPPRRRQPEVMDRPDLDADLHRDALAGLARVNRLSLAGRRIWRRLAPVVGDGSAVIDMACGGGDVTVALGRQAARSGLSLDLEGLDVSPVAVEAARARAAAAGIAARFRVADVLQGPLPATDVIVCSLFLHHLSEEDAVELLCRAGRAARRRVVIEDLRRCRFGSLLAATVPRLLSRSPVVHVDAVRSARAAFTPAEVRGLLRRAGIGDVRVRECWPARMQLVWDPAS